MPLQNGTYVKPKLMGSPAKMMEKQDSYDAAMLASQRQQLASAPQGNVALPFGVGSQDPAYKAWVNAKNPTPPDQQLNLPPLPKNSPAEPGMLPPMPSAMVAPLFPDTAKAQADSASRLEVGPSSPMMNPDTLPPLPPAPWQPTDNGFVTPIAERLNRRGMLGNLPPLGANGYTGPVTHPDGWHRPYTPAEQAAENERLAKMNAPPPGPQPQGLGVLPLPSAMTPEQQLQGMADWNAQIRDMQVQTAVPPAPLGPNPAFDPNANAAVRQEQDNRQPARNYQAEAIQRQTQGIQQDAYAANQDATGINNRLDIVHGINTGQTIQLDPRNPAMTQPQAQGMGANINYGSAVPQGYTLGIDGLPVRTSTPAEQAATIARAGQARLHLNDALTPSQLATKDAAQKYAAANPIAGQADRELMARYRTGAAPGESLDQFKQRMGDIRQGNINTAQNSRLAAPKPLPGEPPQSFAMRRAVYDHQMSTSGTGGARQQRIDEGLQAAHIQAPVDAARAAAEATATVARIKADGTAGMNDARVQHLLALTDHLKGSADPKVKMQLDSAKAIIGDYTSTPEARAAAVETLQRIANGVGQGAAPAQTPSAPSGPVQIQSADDYAKLAPGTPYIDPKGVHRVKG